MRVNNGWMENSKAAERKRAATVSGNKANRTAKFGDDAGERVEIAMEDAR